jgi:hypothetical protein
MRRSIAVPFAGLLVLALAAPAAAAVRSVQVDATAGWVSTGIEVSGGDELSVQTVGFAVTAPIPDFLIPGVAISGSGPAGQSFQGFTCGDIEPNVDPEIVGECPVDDAYFGELVGRVGETTFAIGETDTIVIPDGATGTLELAVNDFTLTYFDNHGSFNVIFR